MKWYSMKNAAAELGICVNTFKKYYINKYPPERVFGNRKEWTEDTINTMKADRNITAAA